MTEQHSSDPAPAVERDDWATNYARHERLLAKLHPVNKATVLAALAAAAITHVIVTFDGGGDSGQIEGVEAKAGDHLVEMPEGEIEMATPVWDKPEPEHARMAIGEAVEHLAWDCLGQTHPGWENNDGAFGDITFDVANASIVLDFNGRYVASDYSQHVF